jgi:nucleoside-diphosphate-sugar epimerase
VRRGVADADVVVHMAFALYGVTPGEDELFATNVEGTLNVVLAAVETGAERLVYISSAAVYGLRADNPQWLSEEADIRASARHFYSRHKAQAELVVHEALAGSETEAYIFRPCAIIGPHAAGATLSGVSPGLVSAGAGLLRAIAGVGLRPFVPAPPVPLQFVHEDDVAQALELAALGAGESGVYNLAAADAVRGREVLDLLGFRALPVPRTVIDGVLRTISSLPAVVPAVVWPALLTEPLLIDASKAREKLGWEPGWDSRAALRCTREALGW